jgi:CRP-like cAMP-binding protein
MSCTGGDRDGEFALDCSDRNHRHLAGSPDHERTNLKRKISSVKHTIMIQQTPQADRFKQQLRESLQHETLNSRAVKIARHANVYTCGDHDEMVYFIESGQIKLLMLSSEGKECLLAIHSAGDIFGELCLSGSGARLETATAMEDTILKQIPGGAHCRPAAGDRQYGDSG